MENSNILKAFLHILSQIVYMLFIVPYHIWCKAIMRLSAQRGSKALEFSNIRTPWPMFTFLRRWFVDFVFDMLIAIIWLVSIYLYFKFEAYKAFKYDFGKGLEYSLLYFYSSYFSVVFISWLRDLFILGLKPIAKFFSWLRKPAQHLDITINNPAKPASVADISEGPAISSPPRLNPKFLFIALGVAMVAGLIAYLINNHDFHTITAHPSIEAVYASTEDVSVAEQESLPEPTESMAPSMAPTMPDTYTFPYYDGSSVGEEMANLITDDGFAGTVDGMTLHEQFQGWHASSMGRLRQVKVSDEGYDYQFFFNSDDGRLSGIALSHYVDDPWGECETIDERLGTSDSDPMVIMPNGAMVSPGHTGDKVYIYYFYPCAPDPNPAPRK